MDTFRTSHLRSLMDHQRGNCVSIYLTTHISGGAGEQDAVRLKNLLNQAERELIEAGVRRVDARHQLQPAREMPVDPGFWDNRSHGLAIFISSHALQAFRLPVEFDELAVVDGRFHIKPLLPLLSNDGKFFVLALSQNKVRLLAASRSAIGEVHVPDLPSSMNQALNYAGAERGSQVHSAMHGSLGKQAAVFHGQGGQADAHKADLTQFFRMIDAALQVVLIDETAPLLLAGVEYELPIYREINSYPYLADEQLTGNYDYLTNHQIHEQAWPAMENTFQKARDEASAKYCELEGKGLTSSELKRIVPAAHDGRSETLFVDVHGQQWGRYNQNDHTVNLHHEREPGDDDLLDLAAVQTLLHRGAVYAVERSQIPGRTPVAAVFRY